MTVAVVVPAAGQGRRLGGSGPKALLEVAGVPLLVHAMHAVTTPVVDLVVVAGPPDALDDVRALVESVAGQLPGRARARVVAGGSSRQASVRAGLDALPPEVDVVLVHDAARAFVPPQVVERVVAAVLAGADAVVPAVPVHDTVRRVGDDGRSAGVVDRGTLRAVQTPQGFRRAVLQAAHAAALADGRGDDATDDASLVEEAGGTVVLVEGAAEAFKVTYPLDLVLAEALVASRARA